MTSGGTAAGDGAYYVADPAPLPAPGADAAGGWSLVVVYNTSASDLRNVVVGDYFDSFDGHAFTTDFPNIFVPDSGPVTATVGMTGVGATPGTTNADALSFGLASDPSPHPLANPNPTTGQPGITATNQALNSSIGIAAANDVTTDGGPAMSGCTTSRSPSTGFVPSTFTGNGGCSALYDASIFDATGFLPPSDTPEAVRLTQTSQSNQALFSGLFFVSVDSQAGQPVPNQLGPFDCSGQTMYVLNSDGSVWDFPTASVGVSASAPISPAFDDLGSGPVGADAFGIVPGGTAAYLAPESGALPDTIYEDDPVTGQSTSVTVAGLPAGLGKGAINPVNGSYYLTGNTGSMYVVSVPANTATSVPITGVPASTGVAGDIAFDAIGNLYDVVDGALYVAAAASVESGGAIAFTLVTSSLPIASALGMAFDNQGYLYLIDDSFAYKVDPATGAQVGVSTRLTGTSVGQTQFDDLAACSYNSSAVMQADVGGQADDTDQFNLTISGGGAANSGPVPLVSGRTYTFTETANSGSLSDYVITSSCVDAAHGNAAVASNAVAPGVVTVTVPTVVGGGLGLVCTFSNLVQASRIVLSASTATAGLVNPGDAVTYTLTIVNTGQVDYPAGTTITDDASDALDDATYVSGSAGVSRAGDMITWTGALPVANDASNPVVATYIVQVAKPDLGNGLLNSAIVDGPIGSNCPDDLSACTSGPLDSPAAMSINATPVTGATTLTGIAYTGTDTQPLLVVGTLLLAVGALVLLAGRRRPRRS